VFPTWRTAEELDLPPDARSQDPSAVEFVLEALIAGPSPEETANHFGSVIDPGTRLLGVSIEQGIATVDIASELASAAGGFSYQSGGGLVPLHRLSELVFTVTQFPAVRGVRFELDGRPVRVRSGKKLGLGAVLDRPVTRDDYEVDRF
jgi:germination protein M